jgi:large subunit ribosomal protein L25
MQTLIAKTRSSSEKLEIIRSSGLVPAVAYAKGRETVSISVPRKELIATYYIAGTSTLVPMEIDGKLETVLFHDMQVNPVTREVMHVDFYLVDASQKISVTVPLKFIGDAPAVKMGLGNLVKTLHDIEIEVMPSELPSHFDIDISVLVDLEKNIYVGDIVLPNSAKLITDKQVIVASVAETQEEGEERVLDTENVETSKKAKKQAIEE